MRLTMLERKISIVILTFNRKLLLEKLLLSVQRLKYHPLEIIVVDNNSTDGTEQMISRDFSQVRYIRTSVNLGVSARNLGLIDASGEIVVTIDDDVFGLDDNGLTVIYKLFSSDPSIGAINFKVINGNNGDVCNWVHHCQPEVYGNKEFLTYEITEGAVAFRKKALDIAGLYVEYFFISHEGSDLAFRLWDKHFKVIYSPMVRVKHYHASEGRPSWRRYYFDTRNLFWLVSRNLPVFYGSRILIRGILSMFVYSLRDGYTIYWFSGVRDGVIGLRRSMRDRRVIGRQAMSVIKSIDKKRPSLSYLVKKRVFRKGVQI
jgi:GT2 family glycosyltransferase